jgi:hypothetical protein
MDLKGFAADHLGHFAPHDIGNAVFSLLVAALLGFLLGRVGAGRSGGEARTLALWAAVAAVALVFVRLQLPLAVGLLALVLLVRRGQEEGPGGVLLFGALAMGLGCGSGAALVTAVVAIPLILLARWARPGRTAQ